MSDNEEPMQLTVFGDEQPLSEVPHMNCTRSKNCPAPADAHADDCPVELALREEMGF